MVKSRQRKTTSELCKPNRGFIFGNEMSSTSGKYEVCKTAFANINGITGDCVPQLTLLLSLEISLNNTKGKMPGNANNRFN